jgi:hypothetical protein
VPHPDGNAQVYKQHPVDQLLVDEPVARADGELGLTLGGRNLAVPGQ